LPVDLIDFMDGANVGMIQRRRRLRLANEARFLRLARHDGRRQKLQRDDTLELGVLGFADDAHAAFAELFNDFVTRDGFAIIGLPEFALFLEGNRFP
jgi:hypothetical protein